MEKKRLVGVTVLGWLLVLIGTYYIFYIIQFIFLLIHLDHLVINPILDLSPLALFIWVPFIGPASAFILATCHLIAGINILQLKDKARRITVKWSIIFAVILFVLIALIMAHGLSKEEVNQCLGSCPPGHYERELLHYFMYFISCCLYFLFAYYFTRHKVKEQFK